MPTTQDMTSGQTRRWLIRILVLPVAVVLLVAPGMAGAGNDDGEASDQEQIADGGGAA